MISTEISLIYKIYNLLHKLEWFPDGQYENGFQNPQPYKNPNNLTNIQTTLQKSSLPYKNPKTSHKFSLPSHKSSLPHQNPANLTKIQFTLQKSR